MPVKNTHYLDVDTKLTNYISVPRVTQNDDVFFIVRILDDGRPVPLSGVQTFLLASLKPNKETILTVGTVSEDEISFKIESAALNVQGRVQASVQLYYTDGRTSTIPFYYEVIGDSSVDYVPDTSETSLIQLVLGDAPFVIEAAQSATIGAEDAAAQTLEALDNFDTEKSVAIQELDDVKEENKTNWKQEVATVALRNSTYPNPQIGDTVRITGEARIDRFNGTEWITTDRYNPAVVDNLTVKLADTVKYTSDGLMKHLASLDVDTFGFKSINIVGDSISQGYNAPEMYKDAWTSVFRKAIQTSFGTENHGYTNLNATSYLDMLYVTTDFSRVNTNNTPGFFTLKSSTAEHKIRAWIQDKTYVVNKVGICVVKTPSSGNIEVNIRNVGAVDIIRETVSLNEPSETHEILWFDVSNSNDVHVIEITNKTGTNIISGMYIMEDIEDIVVNNYSRSGAKIGDLSDGLIDKLFNTNILIFALGHNYTPSATIDAVLDKCRIAYAKYKPMMYIPDFVWKNADKAVSEKLQKFAMDCNGIYIEIIGKVDSVDPLITTGFLNDVSHPTTYGHQVIGERILNAVHAPISSKQLLKNFRESMVSLPRRMQISTPLGFDATKSVWIKTGRFNNVTLDITGVVNRGAIVGYLDKPTNEISAAGQLWVEGSGQQFCGITFSANDASIKIWTPVGVVGNRYTISFSYESA